MGSDHSCPSASRRIVLVAKVLVLVLEEPLLSLLPPLISLCPVPCYSVPMKIPMWSIGDSGYDPVVREDTVPAEVVRLYSRRAVASIAPTSPLGWVATCFRPALLAIHPELLPREAFAGGGWCPERWGCAGPRGEERQSPALSPGSEEEPSSKGEFK